MLLALAVLALGCASLPEDGMPRGSIVAMTGTSCPVGYVILEQTSTDVILCRKL
jgi:hypothetical protein